MFAQLALVVGAGLLGPLLAAGRRPLAPVLVGELIAGAVIGLTGFGIVDPATQPLPAFSTLGFAMLMLSAGTEVDLGSPRLHQGIVQGGVAVLVALAASIPAAVLIVNALHLGHVELFAVLLAGSSAAVAFPTIEERKLNGPAIPLLIAWITLADGVTALLMPLSLTGPARIPLAIAGDALIVVLSAVIILVGGRLAGRLPVDEARRESMQRRWALQLR